MQVPSFTRRSVVVLGMHRGGTSLIARGMKALGVELGEDLMPATSDNPTGYWENMTLYELNQRLLASIEREWHSVAPVCREDGELTDIQALEQEAVQTVAAHFGKFPLWGFKDPRTARLLPFWQDVFKLLGVAENYVLVIRNPISVACSLKTRDNFALEKSYLLWLEHIVEAYTYTTGRPRVLVDYDAVMDRPADQLRRVAERLALPLGPEVEQAIKDYSDEFVDKDLRHSVFEPTDVDLDVHAPQLVSKIYDVLRKVALDQLDADDKQVQSAIASALSDLERFGPFFSYSERLEAERDSIRHERDITRGELDAVRQERDAIRGELDSIREERDAVHRELSEVRDKSTELTAEVGHLRETVLRLDVEFNSKLTERDRRNAELAEKVRRADDELEGTRNELQQALTGLDALTAEKQALFATTESLRVDQERVRSENEALKSRARLLADANAILRPELHNLWNSWSWRLFRPLRNFVRKRQGFGKETEPILGSEPQLIQTVITIRQSVSWELTAPLRLISRILRPRRRFTPPGRVPPAGGESLPLERKTEHNDNASDSQGHQ